MKRWAASVSGNEPASQLAQTTPPEAPENREDLDLTPQGLSDEPAKEEDQESLAKPDNS